MLLMLKWLIALGQLLALRWIVVLWGLFAFRYLLAPRWRAVPCDMVVLRWLLSLRWPAILELVVPKEFALWALGSPCKSHSARKMMGQITNYNKNC